MPSPATGRQTFDRVASVVPANDDTEAATDTRGTQPLRLDRFAPRRRAAARVGRCRVLAERAFGKLSVIDVALDGALTGRAARTLLYRPGCFSPDMPVVIVMHGVTRDAWAYLDSWVGLSELHGFMLIVPEFPRSSWPTSRAYNLGNVRTRAGEDVPPDEWSFTAVETIFDAVRDHFALQAEAYCIYGHSAGAQFVHRFVLHTGGPRIIRAVAANAGWYMVPDALVPFPYGICDLSVDAATLQAALNTPLTVLLGDRDDDPDSPHLRATARARAQGPHRLARGLHFMEVATATAMKLDCTLRWHAKVVREVGHSDRAMAPWACEALIGHRHGHRTRVAAQAHGSLLV